MTNWDWYGTENLPIEAVTSRIRYISSARLAVLKWTQLQRTRLFVLSIFFTLCNYALDVIVFIVWLAIVLFSIALTHVVSNTRMISLWVAPVIFLLFQIFYLELFVARQCPPRNVCRIQLNISFFQINEVVNTKVVSFSSQLCTRSKWLRVFSRMIQLLQLHNFHWILLSPCAFVESL